MKYIFKRTYKENELLPSDSQAFYYPELNGFGYVIPGPVVKFYYIQYKEKVPGLYVLVTNKTSEFFVYDDATGMFDECDENGIILPSTLTQGSVRDINVNNPSYNIKLYSLPTSCTCGTHKTYGKDVDLSAHSSWCELLNKGENK